MVTVAEDGPIVLRVDTQPAPSTPAEFYLDLLKKVLTRAQVAKGMEWHGIRPLSAKSRLVASVNDAIRWIGLEMVRRVPCTADDYLESGHAATNRAEDAETMLGTRQLDHMQGCIMDVLESDVPGDLLEAGVWRGGMTIFMRGVLKAYSITDRRVWVVDSFAGLPGINKEQDVFDWHAGDMAVSLDTVRDNFARYGLLDDQVRFLKGYFSETLPAATIGPLAILRVDADLYESTKDVLENLYSSLSPGGYAIFDDYQNLPDCRRAIDEFRSRNGITEPVQKIDTRAVCWKKRF